MVTDVTRWISSPERPDDIYTLLGLRRFHASRDEVLSAVRQANRALHPYQQHRDASMHERGLALQMQLAKFLAELGDPAKTRRYQSEVLDALADRWRARDEGRSDAELRLWLEVDQQVDPRWLDLVAAVLVAEGQLRTEATQAFLDALADAWKVQEQAADTVLAGDTDEVPTTNAEQALPAGSLARSRVFGTARKPPVAVVPQPRTSLRAEPIPIAMPEPTFAAVPVAQPGPATSRKGLWIGLAAGAVGVAGIAVCAIALAAWALFFRDAKSPESPAGQQMAAADSPSGRDPRENRPAEPAPKPPVVAPGVEGEAPQDVWPELVEPEVKWASGPQELVDALRRERAATLAGLSEVESAELAKALLAALSRGSAVGPGGFPGQPPGIPGPPRPGAPVPPAPAAPAVPDLPERFVLTGTLGAVRRSDKQTWLAVQASRGAVPAGSAPGAFPLVVFDSADVAVRLLDYRAGESIRVVARRTDWSQRKLPTAVDLPQFGAPPLVTRYGKELRLFGGGAGLRWTFQGEAIEKPADEASWTSATKGRVVSPSNLDEVQTSVTWLARCASPGASIRGRTQAKFRSASSTGGDVRLSLSIPSAVAGDVSVFATMAGAELDEFSDYESGDEVDVELSIAVPGSPQAQVVPLPNGQGLQVPADPLGAGLRGDVRRIAKRSDPTTLVQVDGPRRSNVAVSPTVASRDRKLFDGRSVQWQGTLQRVCRFKGETHLLVRGEGYQDFEAFAREADFLDELTDYVDGEAAGTPDTVLVTGTLRPDDDVRYRLQANRPLVELKSVQRLHEPGSLAQVGQRRAEDSFKETSIAPHDLLFRDVPQLGEERQLEARFSSYSRFDKSVRLDCGSRGTSLTVAFPKSSELDFSDYRNGDPVFVGLEPREQPEPPFHRYSLKWLGRSIVRKANGRSLVTSEGRAEPPRSFELEKQEWEKVVRSTSKTEVQVSGAGVFSGYAVGDGYLLVAIDKLFFGYGKLDLAVPDKPEVVEKLDKLKAGDELRFEFIYRPANAAGPRHLLRSVTRLEDDQRTEFPKYVHPKRPAAGRPAGRPAAAGPKPPPAANPAALAKFREEIRGPWTMEKGNASLKVIFRYATIRLTFTQDDGTEKVTITSNGLFEADPEARTASFGGLEFHLVDGETIECSGRFNGGQRPFFVDGTLRRLRGG